MLNAFGSVAARPHDLTMLSSRPISGQLTFSQMLSTPRLTSRESCKRSVREQVMNERLKNVIQWNDGEISGVV